MNELIKKMITNAHDTLKNAYAPYSNYTVASCLCAEDGTLFTGVNVENCGFSLAICAETSAISQMIAAGKHHIKEIVVLAGDNSLCPPCGACRQRIYEFSTPETLIHLCDNQSILKTHTINELLPVAFRLKPSHGYTNE